MSAAAFFDVDGTLWAERSVLSFYRTYLEYEVPREAEAYWSRFERDVADVVSSGMDRAEQNRWFYERHFLGLSVRRVAEVAARWFEERVSRPGFLLKAAVDRARSHGAQGHIVVLVSGSFREIVRPLLAHIGPAQIISAPLEESNGLYTGRLTGPPTIGLGKATAIDSFMAAYGISAAETFGYGDDVTDVPFLERVANPTVVIQRAKPVPAFAQQRAWPRLYV